MRQWRIFPLEKRQGVSVAIFQNVGDPFELWIHEVFHYKYGLDALFFAEHLALVHDRSYAALTTNHADQVATAKWHVKVALSDLPFMCFTRLQRDRRFGESEDGTHLSLQRTRKGHCES